MWELRAHTNICEGAVWPLQTHSGALIENINILQALPTNREIALPTCLADGNSYNIRTVNNCLKPFVRLCCFHHHVTHAPDMLGLSISVVVMNGAAVKGNR